jgi:hypothetical protein
MARSSSQAEKAQSLEQRMYFEEPTVSLGH